MSRRVSSGRLVGRVVELERGRDALSRALHADADPSGRLILISGEAGIGKTRLLHELLHHARASGAVTACGRCVENGGEIRPLSAIGDLLTDLLPIAHDSGMAQYPDLAPLLADGAADRSSALGNEPARLRSQVRSLLAHIAATTPLIVAIEDLHWADRTSRELIAELVRARGLERVGLIATYRSDELHRRHPLLPLLADLEHAARPERIELEPLGENDITDLARAILDRPVSVDAGLVLARRSGGNPFYVEELLASDSDVAQLPAGVRHVILARSQRLEPDAIVCLQAAAVLAAPVDPAVLQATTELASERFHVAIDALCRERFLVEGDGGFRFRHDLVREVFLGELLPGERITLFGQAARALQLLRPERLGEIARLHFNAVQLTDALRSSIRAGLAAEAIGAPAEASEHYGRALDIWDRVDDPVGCAGVSRFELLRSAGRAADLARDFDLAVELGRRAVAEAVGPAEEGAALNALAGYLWNAGAPGLDEVIDRALEVIADEPPSVERAQVNIRAAGRLSIRGDHEGADAALERAAEMAAGLGERGIEANARAHIGYHLVELGDERVLARMHEALDLARSVDDGYVIGRICVNLSNALVFLGRFEEAAALYEVGVDAAERHGLMSTLGILFQGNVIEALEALGRWDEAEEIVEDVARRQTPDSLYRWASALSGWSQIQINRGQHAAAAPTYRRGWQLHETGYYGGEIAQLGSGLIELAAAGVVDPVSIGTVQAWIDELPAGEATYGARMVAAAARHLVPPPGAAHHRQAADAVRGWLDRLDDIAHHHYIAVPPLLDAWLDQARIELAEAEGELAPDSWSRLVAAWDALGCSYFAAVARYRRAAAVLRISGARSAADRATATALLVDAHRVADRLRAEPLLDDIVDLARRAHLRLDLDSCPGQVDTTAVEPSPFGLTRRELEVLRLVSEGHSNGEIGTALFISTKTASVHVSSILRKLHASNRIEAAAIARRHQL